MKFKEYSFQDLLVNIVDNRGKTCPTAETGIPLIATNCIKNDALHPVHEKVRYVDQEIYDTWFRGHPEPGDMIFVCKGSPGRVCWVPDPIDFCIAQDMVAIRADETKVYPKYLFALLRSEETQNKILNMHVGTLIPHFKKGDFKNLYLEIPEDYEYQKQVGDAYFTFCEKTHLNRQTNQTLEQIAQAIFKSWFVDFDPVKAKIAAKQNGQDLELAAMCAISGKTEEQLNGLDAATLQQLKATASLFPDALVESELGEVPEGWGTQTIEDVIELAYGKALKKTNRIDGDYPVYGSGGLTGTHNEFLIDGPGIVIGRKGTVGSLYWEDRPFYPIDTVFYVKCKVGMTLSFSFYLLQTLGLEDMNTDAAVPGLNRNNAYRIEVPKYPNELVVVFTNFVDSFRKQISSKNSEIEALATLRDSLLPKLLSGELAINPSQTELEMSA